MSQTVCTEKNLHIKTVSNPIAVSAHTSVVVKTHTLSVIQLMLVPYSQFKQYLIIDKQNIHVEKNLSM